MLIFRYVGRGGLLTIGYGSVTVELGYPSLDFQSFLVGGLILVLIGAALIGFAGGAKLAA